MFYEVAKGHALPHDPIKALVAPRPIGWVSCLGPNDEVNLAPYSFFNMISDRPHPMVMFSSAGKKDSAAFIEQTGEFVCSIVSYNQRSQLNETSAPLPRGQNEFAWAALEMVPSGIVRPPRVGQAPAALECRYVRTINLQSYHGEDTGWHMVIGEIVGVYIDDRFLLDGHVHTGAMQVIMRGGYYDYFLARDRFEMKRPNER